MKKLVIFLVTAAMLVACFVALIRYVRPAQALDLNYVEVSAGDKIAAMLASRKLELVLTEADIDNLLKKQLAASAANGQLPPQIRIEGAQAKLHGDVLEADVNLRWKDRLPIGAKLFFTLSWNRPNIELIHTRTQIKDVKLPPAWLQLATVQIPIEAQLPKLIGVKEVQFEEDAVRIHLKLGQS
ncbi:hypothetical protein [Paenibacillus hexagrammi]|uniref:DUF2993 domain-containing protein n=1 Tax=Paenibacillus hexagrammi TaxID=2908839 RepID=A0ABY3SFD0_9BACL|nr:hypothetical protein [Paenibacillus sp. YPD9-1]UJF32143.1 hypothetical protein L0M14_20775 [Paenibacillus sp. YPD9-1]